MRWFTTTVALFMVSTAQGRDTVHRLSFHKKDLGKLAGGWQSAKTGMGEGSVWKVVEDKS